MRPFASLVLIAGRRMIRIILFIASAACNEVLESTKEPVIPGYINTTTLYPIANKIISNEKSENINNNNKDTTIDKDVLNKTSDIINSGEDDKKEKSAKAKPDFTKWKIDSTYAEPNPDKNIDDSDSIDPKEMLQIEKPNSESKEFKPSPHLGTFYDEDSFVIPTTREPFSSFSPITKRPAYISSPKDYFKLDYNKKPIINRDKTKPPYRFENSIFGRTKNWKPGLESKPTVEVPVKIPAGGLYKLPDAFKEKPSSDSDDADFGLEFNGDPKETSLKKRVSPWQNLLNLVTAFLPVGLIISALTPSVITLHSSGNSPRNYGFIIDYVITSMQFTSTCMVGMVSDDCTLQTSTQKPTVITKSGAYGNRLSRRLDTSGVPHISEQCKRRLLCEIHSDRNYARQSDRSRGHKHCYRMQCEDPQALERVLRWLLAHHPPGNTYT